MPRLINRTADRERIECEIDLWRNRNYFLDTRGYPPHPPRMRNPQAIARNRMALLAVVAAILALIGGREGGAVARHLRNAALALLRPAEAAARRLIVIAARGVVALPRPAPDASCWPAPAGGRGSRTDSRAPAFRLFDPRKRFGRLIKPPPPAGVPRIRTFWSTPAQPVAIATPSAKPVGRRSHPDPQEPVDVSRLRLRTAALERALADLPRQARRMARWRAQNKSARSAGPRPQSPLRLGRPPGHRRRPIHAVDEVLRECHALAIAALTPDTS